MYEILSACLQVMLALGRGYCLQYFFENFLECRIKERRISGLAVVTVYAVLDFLVWLLEKDYIGADMLGQLASVTAIAVQFFFYGIFLVLSYVILRKIVESFRDKDYDIHRTELYFLIVPGLAGLLICVLLRIMMITIEDDVPQILYDRYPVFNLLVPAILILSLLAIFYSVKTFQDMIALNREKNSRIIMEKQIGNMQESISINISAAGFEAMKNDPEYEAWVLNDLRTGWVQPDRWAGACGGAYSTIYYGATKEECRAQMWSAGYQNGSGKSLFDGKAKDSFWERRAEVQENHLKSQMAAFAYKESIWTGKTY